MILANVRASLGRDDAQLATRLLARAVGEDVEAVESRLRDEGFDAVLDDPRLVAAIKRSSLGAHTSYPLFCYVVVRHALRSVGENDRVLSDYVASIMLHFGLRDAFTRVSATDDEQYDTLAALVEDVDGPDARRNFLVRAHLGNYALWMSGLFPDYIEHRRWRRGGPPLDYYEDLGRRGFQLAADHRLAREHGLNDLYHDAADRFGALRVALNRLSDTMLFPNNNSPDRLMRQVRDESRWRVA
ncbi:MAG: hypothetical protein ABJD07_12045 [Gemmatimonadaceae bacterium]